VIGLQDYWRHFSGNSSIVACRTANPTSFLCCVVGSASLLSATAIFWRLAILRTCRGTWPAVLYVALNRSQMGPQYDICCVLSRTGPLFFTLFFKMGKVSYSHFRSPVRSDTAQSRVWEPCVHLARSPEGILEALRGTRRPPEAPRRISSGIYPGVTWCPLAAIRGRAARGLRIPRGSSVVWGSGGATL